MRGLFLSAILMVIGVAILPIAIRLVYLAFKGKDRLTEEDAIADGYLSRLPGRRWFWMVTVMLVTGLLLIAFGLGGPVDSFGTVVVKTYPTVVTVGAVLVLLSLALALICLRWEQQVFDRYLMRRIRRQENCQIDW